MIILNVHYVLEHVVLMMGFGLFSEGPSVYIEKSVRVSHLLHSRIHANIRSFRYFFLSV